MRSEAKRLDWIEHSVRVQDHLRRALEALSNQLSPAASADVAHFIDHNENGLALEVMLFAAAAEGITIDANTGEIVDAAAVLMQAPRGLWQLAGDELTVRLKESGLT